MMRAGRRRLLDTFADSLGHVNQLYNAVFGFEGRKVPGHMPHFVSRSIMRRLVDTFRDQFEATSARRLRSGADMQFAFSYYYYMMNEQEKLNASQIFELFDQDQSG